MSSVIVGSAGEVASRYVAERYPGFSPAEVGVVELGQGWLVEVASGVPGEAKVLVMVGRSGEVQEMGDAQATRQSAHRGLAVVNSRPGPVQL